MCTFILHYFVYYFALTHRPGVAAFLHITSLLITKFVIFLGIIKTVQCLPLRARKLKLLQNFTPITLHYVNCVPYTLCTVYSVYSAHHV